MSIANASSNEYGKITGGKAGDQTGGEFRVRSWYNGSWDYYFEHPDPNVMEWIAKVAEEGANNDLVGYDQGSDRLTYWKEAAKVGYRPSKIKVKCESDCSSGVSAHVKMAGYLTGNAKLKAFDHTCWTGNLRNNLIAAGFKCYSASKYLTSADYIKRGGILLNEDGGHTCTNLTTGNKAGATTTASTTTKTTGGSTVKIELSILKNGSTGEQVKTLQRLLNALGYNSGKADGIFGANTLKAVQTFQKAKKLDVDGVVGAKTWAAILGV